MTKPFKTTRAEIAQYRYDIDGFIRGSHADNFSSYIIAAAVKADRQNLYKLSSVYPGILAGLAEAIEDDRFIEHIEIVENEE